ncbi:MAG TPA: family 10 glycosylhydrolase [Pseudobacteroides sp.]|nr:family 10 glycosylhydrolase [Pseudobacteroides sp.]
MKNIIKLLLIITILSTSIPSSASLSPITAMANSTSSPVTDAPDVVADDAADAPVSNDLRGLWVATVVNIDYPQKPTTDSETLKQEALKVLDYAKDLRLNAIFLQVRPTSDALYQSKYFPWSKYLTGKQGLSPSNSFDPLKFWVDEAHKRGLTLHAWINPYRITKKSTTDAKDTLNSLAPSNPARLHPEWVIKYKDGNYYYDPGIPEVRKLIIDGALEIIDNYQVDGIHFDDYFYPGTDFNDNATYKKYGSGFKNVDDWRRSNVNKLIYDLSNAIKAKNKDIRFGISPFGIWANKKKNPLGSDTNGGESYYSHYADTRKWVKESMIDYIAPQLYWYIGHNLADYSKLLTWWANTVKGTGVDLYIGQAAYLSNNTDPSSPWYGISEIERQLKLNEKTPEVKGSIFFNYNTMAKAPSLSALIKSIHENRDNLTTKAPITLAKPTSNINTSLDKYYIYGTSDPSKPLYLNGTPIEGRSDKGYFGTLVPLSEGPNILTLSQEGSYITRIIYRDKNVQTPTSMSSPAIPASSVFPQSRAFYSVGEKITLSCQAPVGSTVTVKLDGKKYTLKPKSVSTSGSGIYATTYTYEFTAPSYTGTPRNIDLGAPVYTMTYKNVTKTQTAPAKIGIIMKDSPFFAKVTTDVANTYLTTNTSDGAAHELYKGMVDRVTAIKDDFVRLSSGQWIKSNNVTTYTSATSTLPAVTKLIYKQDKKWDSIEMLTQSHAATYASFEGSSLKINIPAPSTASMPVLPQDSLFSSITASSKGLGTEYTLKLNDNKSIEGYYVEKKENSIIIHVKKPVKAVDGKTPLSGITIMIDPGHGGSETGAIGPLGLNYPEKDLNLFTSLKLKLELEKRGANVLITRTTDKTLSLDDRLTASRNAKPDMFISVHANSMADNVDISQIEGFSVFYREDFAKTLGKTVLNGITNKLGRADKGLHKNNFYVTRGTWTPSILVESGFMPNPTEFEWLINDYYQSILAKSIADTIVQYFSR